MDSIQIFSPATVANVSCGFDVLGFALHDIGDEMLIRRTKGKEICIKKIKGHSEGIPLEINKNVVGVAVLSMLKELKIKKIGLEIEIKKNIKPGSGIGSSASSSAGIVWALNRLFGNPLSNKKLIGHAMYGELLASGSLHADNVSSCILGGFNLVRSCSPLDIIELPTPKDLYTIILHPQIEVKTSDSRKTLKNKIDMTLATQQWGNLGAFVSALYTSDYDLISRSLQDVIVEPLRKKFIPHFDEMKKIALDGGALGFGISGSGPSTFSIIKGKGLAKEIYDMLNKAYSKYDISFEIHLTSVGNRGVRIIN